MGHRTTGRYPGSVNRHLGIGWEFVLVCIDDASCVAFVQVMLDQRKESAVAFLEAAIAYSSLSIYPGHTHVTDTYWYLQATPILMRQIKAPGETLHNGTVA